MKFAAKLFLLYEKSVQHKKACEAGTKENKTKGFFKEEKIMVVVLKPDTKEEQIENLKVWLSSMGISTHISRLSQVPVPLKAKRRFVKSQKESKRQAQVCCVAAHSSPEPPPTHSRV